VSMKVWIILFILNPNYWHKKYFEPKFVCFPRIVSLEKKNVLFFYRLLYYNIDVQINQTSKAMATQNIKQWFLLHISLYI